MREFNQLGLAIVLAGYGMSAVAAVEDAGHINLGPVEMTPMASAGIGYDDNVYREGEGDLADKGSTVYKLNAEAEFKAQTGLSTYAATLAARNTSYSSQSDANFTDVGVKGDIHQEFNSRNRLDAKFDVGRYHDAGSTVNGDIDKAAPEYDKTQGSLKYGFGSLEALMRADLFGSYDKKNYNAGGQDRKTTEYGATGYYQFMPKTSALVEIKERKLDYTQQQNAAYDITSYLLGLNWEATAKSNGYAKLGRRYRDATGTDRQGYTGWEVGVSYLPVDYSLIQLSTTRDYGLESDNPAEADFTQGTTTRLTWQHQWTGKISTRANYSYSDEEVQGSSGITKKDRTVNQLGLAVDWNVKRNIKVSASWQHTNRDEADKNGFTDAEDYKRNYYMLSGTLAL
ncbi:hypothetical protein [Endozoicomonas sp. GU-1]|uniref:hypothetical protein n=1 Tax=Endozoicomonas sp. GU-1 TaxID=3009078 RepID=UPI0022B55200|nr:hypothetical protein [Endozoicomonas sp. GU-1]WBA81497.1 hypothetical protein O2T12_25015 [Endozoicomonas sp. GU-1]WBA84445.1 hypothetical protein O3276_14175 [Endozoicomonas sp. GU-1]